ncbi:hypothetical protein [Saccharibacillus kuerlensis]|uniref:Uncharacterized protein n=1 Tax=Saccharibacillus kuerlensis TaxID=459527 RepID=A0ABQ2L7R7_9BACL|nr:hypothetical protein [Saccharibacillus kuerlensis]GGO03921.1 hypothetical protein GCM10010969_28600 [Saccharibacillus kuerlensis]
MMEAESNEREDGPYNEKLKPIDKQICELLKQRKDISQGEPGQPQKALIAEWSGKYGFYEDYLQSIFGTLANEAVYKPLVVPTGFRRQVPVLRSAEQNNIFYSIVTVRQYDNASVIMLNADWEEEENLRHSERTHWECVLEVTGDQEYDCRMRNGSGTNGQMSQTFVISPPLPEDLLDIVFRVRVYEEYGRKKPLGPEIILE